MKAEFLERLDAAVEALEKVAECRLMTGDLNFRALARGLAAVRSHAEAEIDNAYRSLFLSEVIDRKDSARKMGQAAGELKIASALNAARFRRWYALSRLEHETIAWEAMTDGVADVSERYKVPEKAVQEVINELKQVRRGRPRKKVKVKVRETALDRRARRRQEREEPQGAVLCGGSSSSNL